MQLDHDPKPWVGRRTVRCRTDSVIEERLSSWEHNSEDHEMKPANRLAQDHHLMELEASLDLYIEERKRFGTPATREDLVNWCGQNHMPVGIALKRVGRMLGSE
jgi:hypothetical protein